MLSCRYVKHLTWCNRIMNKEFENILDDCLERLLFRGETMEDCLKAYPQQAGALKPLLQTALLTRKATRIKPRPEFKARVRYQFRTALRESAPNREHPFSIWRFRWATALVAILVMLMASSGLVVAASSSMPDSPLYSVKLAVEQMQLNLTFSDLGKAKLYAKFADRRISEIMHMAKKGDASQVTASADLLGKQLSSLTNLNSDTERSLAGEGKNVQDNEAWLGTEQTAVTSPPEMFTPPPTPATSTPIPATSLPPQIAADDVFKGYTAEAGKNSELYNLLLQDGLDNSAALRDLLATVPESIKTALLEAIEVAETGYLNALNAINE